MIARFGSVATYGPVTCGPGVASGVVSVDAYCKSEHNIEGGGCSMHIRLCADVKRAKVVFEDE